MRLGVLVRTHELVVAHEAAELASGAQVIELAQREACARGPLAAQRAAVKCMAQIVRDAVRAFQQQHNLARSQGLSLHSSS